MQHPLEQAQGDKSLQLCLMHYELYIVDWSRYQLSIFNYQLISPLLNYALCIMNYAFQSHRNNLYCITISLQLPAIYNDFTRPRFFVSRTEG